MVMPDTLWLWLLKILVLVAIFSSKDKFYANGTEICVHGQGQPGCPIDTCCRQEICKENNILLDCCENTEVRGCSNCPACLDCKWSEWTQCIIKCPEGQSNTNPIQGRRYRYQDPPRGPGARHCENENITSEVCLDKCKVNTDEKEGLNSIATFVLWVYLVNTILVAPIYTYFEWQERKSQGEGLRLRLLYWFGLIVLAFIVPISGFYMLAYKWLHKKFSRAEPANKIDDQNEPKTFRLPLKNATFNPNFRTDSNVELKEYHDEWKDTDNQTGKTTELGKSPEYNSSQIILDQLPNIDCINIIVPAQ